MTINRASDRAREAEVERLAKPHITKWCGHWHYVWLGGFCGSAGSFCRKLNNKKGNYSERFFR